jgi:hypothetical protein
MKLMIKLLMPQKMKPMVKTARAEYKSETLPQSSTAIFSV